MGGRRGDGGIQKGREREREMRRGAVSRGVRRGGHSADTKHTESFTDKQGAQKPKQEEGVEESERKRAHPRTHTQ